MEANIWNLVKIALEEEVDTGPLDMRGGGTAVASVGGAVVPPLDATE